MHDLKSNLNNVLPIVKIARSIIAGLFLDQQVPDFILNPRERFRDALTAEGLIEKALQPDRHRRRFH